MNKIMRVKVANTGNGYILRALFGDGRKATTYGEDIEELWEVVPTFLTMYDMDEESLKNAEGIFQAEDGLLSYSDAFSMLEKILLREDNNG